MRERLFSKQLEPEAMPKIIRTRHFPMRPFYGISLFGLLIFRSDARLAESDIRHETIHYLQQREWLFVGFFILYMLEFVWHLIRLRRWEAAYRSVSFEREAYRHERDAGYLRHRHHYANFRRPP